MRMRFSQFAGAIHSAALVAVSAILAFGDEPKPKDGKIDEATYDRIVEDFIQYDIGNIRDPIAVDRIRTRFYALTTDEAVPALVRGLNRSTRMRASCPITAISTQLRGLMNKTKDSDVATHVLKHLERRDVGRYNYHMAGVFSAAEKAVTRAQTRESGKEAFDRRVESDQQRLAFVPGKKLTDLPLRGEAAGDASDGGDSKATGPAESRSNATAGAPKLKSAPPAPPANDLKKLSVAELVGKLDQFELQPKVLEELHRRASSSDSSDITVHDDALIKTLEEGDAAVREMAARLIGLVRLDKAAPKLIDALEDSNPHVRSAAATALTRITRQLFGPNENASADDVKKAVARWREWWARQSKGPQR
jgi:hypothetical protein